MHGQVSRDEPDMLPRLEEVFWVARQRWGGLVTQRSLVKVTGLNFMTMSKLFRCKTLHYNFQTLAWICWYFGCDVQDILRYVPPPSEQQRTLVPIPSPTINRPEPPTTGPSLPPHLENNIHQKLTGKAVRALQRETGISRPTLVSLMQPHSQIGRATLARLYRYFSRAEAGFQLRQILSYVGETEEHHA